MKKEQKQMLIEENKKNLEALALLDPKTEEYSVLVKRIDDIQEIINKDKTIEKLVDYTLKGVSIAAPLICYGVWFNKGLKFEIDGTISSSFVRNLVNKSKDFFR